MSDKIVNRVANSALQVIDLEELYQEGTRTLLSITAFLDDGVVLVEQTFRERLQSHDWNKYQDQFVAVHCPDDVLVPQWATLLVVTHLQPLARYVVVGTVADLEQQLFAEQLALMDFSPYKDGLVMIKGSPTRTPISVFNDNKLNVDLRPYTQNSFHLKAYDIYSRRDRARHLFFDI